MTLTRITSTLAAVALGGVVVATTYGAEAARTPALDRTGDGQHARETGTTSHFQAPVPHRYGPNGMRMGLHCEDHDPS
jgi:hypothetical protein